MKKFGRKLAIVLVMMMIFTSFEFVGVFADDTPEGEPAIAEESATESANEVVATPAEEGAGNEAVPGEGETPDPDPTTGITAEDLAITDVKLLSSDSCVILRWRKLDIEGVQYVVYDCETDKPVSVNIEDYKYMDNPRNGLSGDYLMCKIEKPVSDGFTLKEYRYAVQAKLGDVEGEVVRSNLRGPIRTIAYKFTVKKGTTLKKHGGNGPSTYKLKKGQTLICYGFGGGGCYMFKYKGSIFYCAKIRVKKPVAFVRRDWNYTPEEAEYFLNHRSVNGNRNVFLWCNQYTQHMYYMQGSKGNWKCTDDWECSTGKPKAPTPTGMYGVKKIEGKWKKHHNIKWWSKFSGTNSVHGQKKGWTFGTPKSNGCIRNPVAKAEKVYFGAPVGTGLYIF